MARVSKGNSLSGLVLQPGWTIEEDGFGLLTSRLTFVTAHGSGEDSSPTILDEVPRRGDAHPKDSRLQCHRSSSTLNANGLAVVVSEYVGIASGNMTAPEVSGRGNMSTEPIASHPRFATDIGGTPSAPLNGAVFANSTFKEFSYDPSAVYQKQGVRSYLAPGFGVNGHFYTSDIAVARALKESVGKSSGSGKFANIQLLGSLTGVGGQNSDSWYGQWTTADEIPQLLLTGISLEFFGNLVKVSYDVTFAPYGWDRDIYDLDASSVIPG